MVTIRPALRQVSKDLAKLLERSTVERMCREVGPTWRARQFDPCTPLHVFILQMIHRNTAMAHLPHLSGERFTASAYCRARQRFPVEVIRRLGGALVKGIARAGAPPRGQGQRVASDRSSLGHGHRVAILDGSAFSMPDPAELQAHFGQPGGQKVGCGFPVAHLLALLDAHTGLLHEVILSPLRTHDMKHAADLHPRLSPGDILVADRGLCSYVHWARISRANLHAGLRVHPRQIVSFHPHRLCAEDIAGKGSLGIPTSRRGRRRGYGDPLVTWRKPQSRPAWMTEEAFAELPEELLVREIKYRIANPGRRRPGGGRVQGGCRVREVTRVTTLLDPRRYPAAEIAELYRRRWRVEGDLRDLKITLGMDVLKGHHVDTVVKEVLCSTLIYNWGRLVAMEGGRRQHVPPRRISFIDALRGLQPPKAGAPLPAWGVNPERPGRVEPRCIKRRPKQYERLTQPRETLRKRLRKRGKAA